MYFLSDQTDIDVTIKILFENDYRKDGTGLHSYVDPTDDKQYLYTQCETYYCNRIFPCFDQPNIKGTYELNIISEKDWVIIANENHSAVNNGEFALDSAPLNLLDESLRTALVEAGSLPVDNLVHRTYTTTKLFSTYLFAVFAGPY